MPWYLSAPLGWTLGWLIVAFANSPWPSHWQIIDYLFLFLFSLTLGVHLALLRSQKTPSR